jgi:hypothetical protein
MTKQRKPLNWTEFELCWGTRSPSGEFIPNPLGNPVRVTGETMANDAVVIALGEQAFAIYGPASFARLLAWRLRQPSPSRAVLDDIARMLDPSEDGYLKLKVVRHRKGKTATRSVNDAAIAKAILRSQQKLGRKRLSKTAVGTIADQFEVSEAKVRKVISQIRK